jgi:hypothetical protein
MADANKCPVSGGTVFMRTATDIGAIALIGAVAVATPSAAYGQVPSAITVPCSSATLSGAITTANGLGTAILRLAPNCTYSITTPAVATSALPQITGNITLLGGPSTTIRRDPAAPTTFRVLDVAAGATLHARGIAIQNGNDITGGGILNSGTVTLDFVTLSGNNATTGDGGGFANGTATAHALIVHSLIKGNTAGGGGGIANSGTLTLVDSRVTANSAPIGGGGGIVGELDSTAIIIRSTLDHNFVGFGGGGILNFGALSLDRTLIVSNANGAAEGFTGGGVYNVSPPGTVNSRRSIIRGNRPTNCFPSNAVQGCVN